MRTYPFPFHQSYPGSLGLTDDEIKDYLDPDHWLKVFPFKALDDLKLFGSRVDFRR